MIPIKRFLRTGYYSDTSNLYHRGGELWGVVDWKLDLSQPLHIGGVALIRGRIKIEVSRYR